MTFCVAMKVSDGIVALSDTRITSGSQYITASKVTIHQDKNQAMFIMTSGLRSLRDKALTYFEEILDEDGKSYDKLYKAVNAIAAQLRRVAAEDKQALNSSGFTFDLHTIIGGQFEKDKQHKLYLLYPEGNWVEVGRGTPYFIIGESAYGKPILDRALRYESSIKQALKIGLLAFDATRASAANVEFPLDTIIYKRDFYKVFGHRYKSEDVRHISKWWQDTIVQAVYDMPEDWLDAAMNKVEVIK